MTKRKSDTAVMKKSARRYAAEAVMRMESGGYSNIVIDNMLNNCELNDKDKNFASAIVYGVTERCVTIDEIIAKHSKTEKLSPEVRAILRCALYQIIYMDSVPDNAAVNEAVELTKEMRVRSAGGFVNAVLRGFLREGISEELKNDVRFKYSCSADVYKILSLSIGKEKTNGYLDGTFGKPPMFIRVNTLKIAQDEFIAKYEELYSKNPKIVSEADNCLIIEDTCVTDDDLFKNGLYHVQDLSSQLCVNALEPKPGMRVLDCCSAPGGKSFTLAQKMNGIGKILSCDIHKNRIQLVDEGKKRLGIKIIDTAVNDAAEYNIDFGEFDAVLCDVPCSGLGVIRRKPEIKYKKENEIAKLYGLQFEILMTSSKYVRSGGTLIYSTCSLNKSENEDIVNKFLKVAGTDFELSPFQLTPKESLNNGIRTILPEEYNSDGFFIAKLKRK